MIEKSKLFHVKSKMEMEINDAIVKFSNEVGSFVEFSVDIDLVYYKSKNYNKLVKINVSTKIEI